ncbi:hypothetical protein CTAYLR_000937 [Chrysophaeum taylorii]|uniref:SecA DEAD-like N-terminal domain-containing protein n=1 Tax=Chrysophaeum taylorii TaxID=2483200 RepID=A0AAD7UF74_9STRA|nr:hypothetical protein CTAYLR_000937 [Chrysophaeum taylorii]
MHLAERFRGCVVVFELRALDDDARDARPQDAHEAKALLDELRAACALSRHAPCQENLDSCLQVLEAPTTAAYARLDAALLSSDRSSLARDGAMSLNVLTFVTTLLEDDGRARERLDAKLGDVEQSIWDLLTATVPPSLSSQPASYADLVERFDCASAAIEDIGPFFNDETQRRFGLRAASVRESIMEHKRLALDAVDDALARGDAAALGDCLLRLDFMLSAPVSAFLQHIISYPDVRQKLVAMREHLMSLANKCINDARMLVSSDGADSALPDAIKDLDARLHTLQRYRQTLSVMASDCTVLGRASEQPFPLYAVDTSHHPPGDDDDDDGVASLRSRLSVLLYGRGSSDDPTKTTAVEATTCLESSAREFHQRDGEEARRSGAAAPLLSDDDDNNNNNDLADVVILLEGTIQAVSNALSEAARELGHVDHDDSAEEDAGKQLRTFTRQIPKFDAYANLLDRWANSSFTNVQFELIVRVKQAVVGAHKTCLESLKAHDLSTAQSQVEAIETLLPLSSYVDRYLGEPISAVHEQLRQALDIKSNDFKGLARSLLEAEEFEKLAAVLAGQEALCGLKYHESYVEIRENIWDKVHERFERASRELDSIACARTTKFIAPSRGLRDDTVWLENAKPLADALGGLRFANKMDLLESLADRHVKRVLAEGERSLASWKFDTVAECIEGLEGFVVNSFPTFIVQPARAIRNELQRALEARLEGWSEALREALLAGDYPELDRMFACFRLDDALSNIPRLRENYQRVFHELEEYLSRAYAEVKQLLANNVLEIKQAHQKIRQLKRLTLAAIAREAMFDEQCIDLEEELKSVKQLVFSERGLCVVEAHLVKRALDDFSAIDPLQYHRNMDRFLEALKVRLVEVEESLQHEFRDYSTSPLGGANKCLDQFQRYEVALAGHNTVILKQIRQYRETLHGRLMNVCADVLDDIRLEQQHGNNGEAFERGLVYLRRVTRLLEKCDINPEETEKMLYQVSTFDHDNKSKVTQITTTWNELVGPDCDIFSQSSGYLSRVSMLLLDIERHSVLLRCETKGAPVRTPAVALQAFANKCRGVAKSVLERWEKCDFQSISNLVRTVLHATSDVNAEMLSRVEETVGNVKQLVIRESAALAARALGVYEKTHQLARHASEDDARALYGQLNDLLERLQQIDACFCPDVIAEPQISDLLTRMKVATSTSTDKILSEVGESTYVAVTRALLNLHELPAYVSNAEVKAHADACINKILDRCYEMSRLDFMELAKALIEANARGGEIVESFSQFEKFRIERFNVATARLTFEDAFNMLVDLNKLRDPSVLKRNYAKFDQEYTKLVNKHLYCRALETVVAEIVSQKEKRTDVPFVIAGIFAVWSLNSMKHGRRADEQNMRKPHPVQILTILRLLGLDHKSSWISSAIKYFRGRGKSPSLQNHLAQVKTGEGKSVILGVLATLLAIEGYRVDVVCYSAYLSRRDAKDFERVFDLFQVSDKVKYSTFGVLSEEIINARGSIRNKVLGLLEDRVAYYEDRGPSPRVVANRDAILLIDEVDVFLAEDFYGCTYNPVVSLQYRVSRELLRFLYANRSDSLHVLRVKLENLPAYAVLLEQFSPVAHFHYEVVGGRIGYRIGMDMSFSTSFGYRTAFAYLREYENGNVTDATLERELSLMLHCGSFSYAELPKCYAGILGVSGTLETLSAFEEKVITEQYKVTAVTLTPSIYGDSKLDHKEDQVRVVDDDASYNRQLLDEILTHQSNKGAVLVFFETEARMDRWADSEYARHVSNLNRVKVTTENIDHYVRQATRSGYVTLFSSVHGRGLDFVCHDKAVQQAGGVLVVQTFLSESLTEQLQIMGRTARQDKKGKYRLVVHADDLLSKFDIKKDDLDARRGLSSLYGYLDKKRNDEYQRKNESRQKAVDKARQLHDQSMRLKDALITLETCLPAERPAAKEAALTRLHDVCLSV